MNMEKTLFISDLDGTLLNNAEQLSSDTTQRLNALLGKGLHFSVATARSKPSAQELLADLTLSLPIVLMNGVACYDTKHQQYVQLHTLSSALAAEVIRILRQFEVTSFLYQMQDNELVTYHETHESAPTSAFTAARISKHCRNYRHIEGFDRILPDCALSFSLYDTLDHLLPIQERIARHDQLKTSLYANAYHSDMWYLEIFSEASSKENGVQYLRDTYGFQQIIGFGDGLNDLSLFAACDVKVAVGNARPELKEIADYICGTNVENGVVQWIEAQLDA